jgi:hypothetical protein
MPCHAADSAAKSYGQWHYRDELATVRCRCQVMLATVLSSHADDGAADVTCPRGEVDTESCCDSGVESC